jgi:hypothetical protein
MSKCSQRFVPALFAGVVAGTNLATMTGLLAQTAARAAERTEAGSIQTAQLQLAQVADNCLTAPRGATPAGSHWYYRIDRATKRQCWYLREENENADDKFARAAPPASPPSADAPQTRKFSDARAEYVARQPRAEPVRAETRSIAEAAPAPAVQNGQRAAAPNVLAPAPLSSMRWNDAGASAAPATLQLAAATAEPVEPPPQQPQTGYVQQPTAEQIAALAVEPPKPTASLQKLLVVMAAALAFAGLMVSAIVRIGRMRARRAMRKKRRAMWDAARVKKRAAQPMLHDEDARLRQAAGGMQPQRPSRDRTFQHRAVQERAFHERSFQEGAFQERAFQDRPFQEHAVQARGVQERTTRVPRERAPAMQESYAPANRRPAAPEREREQQVTEMLARLARSAQT